MEEAQHRPNLVLQLMSRCVYAARGLDGSARVAIDVEIKQLQDALGGCERILRNPIPLNCAFVCRKGWRLCSVSCHCDLHSERACVYVCEKGWAVCVML